LLTDTKCRAKPTKPGPYKLYDALGLYLAVTPGGSRLWRWRFLRPGGQENVIALGSYPDVSLAEARRLRDEHRRTLAGGQDPAALRRAAKLVGNPALARQFESVARSWHSRQAHRWGPDHARDIMAGLEADVFPHLGRMDVDNITVPLVLGVLRRIEARGARAIAHRVRGRIERVFAFGISCGIGRSNPARDVGGALEPVLRGQMPALTTLPPLRAMLRACEAQPAATPVQAALRWTALTASRPGPVRRARWDQIDLSGNLAAWRVDAAEMKTREPWVCPLSGHALDVLRAIEPLTGAGRYIFPAAHDGGPLGENSMGALLERSGYRRRHTSHGFRASFSTIMNEARPEARDAVEAQLSHRVVGTRGAYLRASFLEQRVELMAEWAAMLMEGAPDAQTLLGPQR
jgi:integrase